MLLLTLLINAALDHKAPQTYRSRSLASLHLCPASQLAFGRTRAKSGMPAVSTRLVQVSARCHLGAALNPQLSALHVKLCKLICNAAIQDWWWKARLGKCYYQLGMMREAEKQFLSALESEDMVTSVLELGKVCWSSLPNQCHAPHDSSNILAASFGQRLLCQLDAKPDVCSIHCSQQPTTTLCTQSSFPLCIVCSCKQHLVLTICGAY